MKHVDLIQLLSAFPLETETIMTFTITADDTVVTDNKEMLRVLLPDGRISNRVSDIKDKRQVTMEDGLLFLENLQYSFYGSRLWATKVLD